MEEEGWKGSWTKSSTSARAFSRKFGTRRGSAILQEILNGGKARKRKKEKSVKVLRAGRWNGVRNSLLFLTDETFSNGAGNGVIHDLKGQQGGEVKKQSQGGWSHGKRKEQPEPGGEDRSRGRREAVRIR